MEFLPQQSIGAFYIGITKVIFHEQSISSALMIVRSTVYATRKRKFVKTVFLAGSRQQECIGLL